MTSPMCQKAETARMDLVTKGAFAPSLTQRPAMIEAIA